MRAPDFWWREGSGGLLSPLGSVYGAVAAARLKAPGQRAGVPVICLGNLTVGGGGKTPAALAVARLLLNERERPFFLSRGYGGRLPGPVRVRTSMHTAADVGDEPVLLARLAPTIVARDRVAGAEAAKSGGASVIVMDDGFQNPSLVKDLSILVVDGRRGIGNGLVFPAGPLRAALGDQIALAQALLIVGPPGASAAKVEHLAMQRRIPVLHARFEPDPRALAALGGRAVLAFAGIAEPEKFFATLVDAGVIVTERASFPDHHRYNPAEARALLARAETTRLLLLTTEKDQARLAGDPRVAALAQRSAALPVRLVVQEEYVFAGLITTALARR